MTDEEKRRSAEEIENDILTHFHVAFDETIKQVTLKHKGKVIKVVGKGKG